MRLGRGGVGFMTSMHRRIRALVGGLAIFVVAVALLAAWRWTRRQCWGGDVMCEGILVDGVPLPSGVSPEHFIAERARALSLRTLEIGVRDRPELRGTFSVQALGVRLDEARLIDLVRAVGHRGKLADRVADAR